MNKYRLIKKLGEGTFSEVFKAQSLKTGAYVAIKCMKNYYASDDQVSNLREIQALKRLSSNQNIITMIEYLYDETTGRLSIVCELMDHNLYEAIKGRKNYLTERKIKVYMYQLLKALDYMHRSGIFHRDIKPENILLKDDHLVLADLGSCKGIYSKPPFTEYISTRWYRAPECLLTDGYYNFKMDLWGVGCVLFEISSLFPLFPGDNEIDQICKIQNILGPITPEVLSSIQKHSSNGSNFIPSQKPGIGITKFLTHTSHDLQDLILKLLTYNPEDRYSAKQALQHPFFKELLELETKPPKISLNNFHLMKSSFHNDSQSMIKSTEETQVNTNKINTKFIKKEKDKTCILPEIKVNKNINNLYDSHSPKSKSDSEDYDSENNYITHVKLPVINKQSNEHIGVANNLVLSNLKTVKNINTISVPEISGKNNQSMEILINTIYSKKLNINKSNISKKLVNRQKKSYISPYSQKKILGSLKV